MDQRYPDKEKKGFFSVPEGFRKRLWIFYASFGLSLMMFGFMRVLQIGYEDPASWGYIFLVSGACFFIIGIKERRRNTRPPRDSEESG